jgi:hypothetical protein
MWGIPKIELSALVDTLVGYLKTKGEKFAHAWNMYT